MLHMIHHRRKTKFGATPVGFHHTCYNILKKYEIFSVWDESTMLPNEEWKLKIKSAIWRHHWEHDLMLAKAYHTPLSTIFLPNIRPGTVKSYYKPHSLLRSLKSINLPRSTLSKALRYWTTPIRERKCSCEQLTTNLPRHMFFNCLKSRAQIMKYKTVNNLAETFQPSKLQKFLRSLLKDENKLRNFHVMLSELDFPRF